MSELRRDEIIYDEGWRSTGTDDTAVETEKKPTLPDLKPQEQKPLLIVLQLFLSVAAALVLFLLKAMDSGAYHDFMRYYHAEMSKPVISQQMFDAVDWNALTLGVSVTATEDEIPAR